MNISKETCERCKLGIEVIGVEHIQDQVEVPMYKVYRLVIDLKGACGLDDEFSLIYNCEVDNNNKLRGAIDAAQQNTALINFLQKELTYNGRCRIFDHSDLKRT